MLPATVTRHRACWTLAQVFAICPGTFGKVLLQEAAGHWLGGRRAGSVVLMAEPMARSATKGDEGRGAAGLKEEPTAISRSAARTAMARGRGNPAAYPAPTQGTADPGPAPQSPQVAWHKCSEEARFPALAKGHACEREGELWRLRLQRVKAAPGGGPCSGGQGGSRRRLWVEARAQSSELSPRCSPPAVTWSCCSCCALSAPSCLQGHEGSASLQEGRCLAAPGEASLPPLLARDRPQCGSGVLGNVLGFRRKLSCPTLGRLQTPW